MDLKKYIISLTAWLLIPYVVGLVVLLFIVPQYYFSAYPYIILVFIALGFAFFPLLRKNNIDKQNKFFALFIGNTFLKLIVSAACILLYILLIKKQIVPFVVVFLVFYVFLSLFETKTFVRISKRK